MSNPIHEDPEALAEFVTESAELLQALERSVMQLERNPNARDILKEVFRCVHNLKGTCGWMGFAKLEGLNHVAEEVLANLMAGDGALSGEVVGAFLALADKVAEILETIRKTGTDSNADIDALKSRLQRIGQSPTQEMAPAAEGDADIHQGATPTSYESTVRVDLGLLDRLMNQAGELVLVRNEILQHSEASDGALDANTLQRLNQVTMELQEGIMKTRMQPIQNVWNKFPRLVRDLAHELGKKVHLEVEGGTTELDRSLLEAIKDPLNHLVRNALDHGLESASERKQAGKNETGTIILRAYHEGGQVNIEIADDGRGIDAKRVAQRAVEKGLVSRAAANSMAQRELVQFVFEPGFSTAEKVSAISGRGVGMDVVRTNIEAIGGSVELSTKPGDGTTTRLRIPLTLAIIPALVVGDDGSRYAIPQVSLVELVHIDPQGSRHAIDHVHGAPVLRLRGDLLPMAHLNDVLKGSQERASKPWQQGQGLSIVILDADGRRFALAVDAVHDTEEIVVKPLGEELRSLSTYAGATIMGDGRIALILDVVGIARQASVFEGAVEQTQKLAESVTEEDEVRHSVLVFGHGQNRMATPLSSVARLEEFSKSALEHVGERDFIQYRDSILPLVGIRDIVEERRKTPRAPKGDVPAATDSAQGSALQVIVYRQKDQQVGMVVDHIVDIVEEHYDLDDQNRRSGVSGVAVIDGKITEIIDIEAVIAMGMRNMSDAKGQVPTPTGQEP